jgi:hypothetical protein
LLFDEFGDIIGRGHSLSWVELPKGDVLELWVMLEQFVKKSAFLLVLEVFFGDFADLVVDWFKL